MYRQLLLILFAMHSILLPQENGDESVELFLIDSYVTPDVPNIFRLSFFTSDSCSSRIIIDGRYKYIISERPTDDHKFEIDFSDLDFDSLSIPYTLIITDRDGSDYTFDEFDVVLPDAYKLSDDKAPGIITVCCFGGIIFGLPSPGVAFMNDKYYFELSKEIPLLSYYSSGYNYPDSYFGIEYGYIFNAPFSHQLKLGYKYIFRPGTIEYFSPGLNIGTNFKGNTYLSPELSVGLFKIYNVFTVYLRYRYNYDLGSGNSHLHEASIGLFSNFFSINL